ncbi:hypothetical protein Halru_2096 [Halovivax ruber XH-70]|uniref:DUF7993 domain-containing protein n=1 Tax=Halovivax ruber (strain DSM 18193 / JCM 13892 / XH-70) TaxID=797302 RepID=L0ICX5_HALRX|nr:hypothetical protein [Halovivax ruber]AGB16688.1 hypothetical protein Halru_2096 [Halovivax ruber XH-70]
MVEERVTDGIRIAELLASEVEGRTDGPLGSVRVTDADTDVEPTADGARAYTITGEAGDDTTSEVADTTLATVNVHDDRIHLAFRVVPDVATDAASGAGLRTRPKATTPPQTLVFVESGGAVKRAVEVLATVCGRVGE